MSRERSNAVVDGVRQQVKEKLLADFYEALKKTEAGARELHAPFGERHRLEIMMGFAQGCIAAGAEAVKASGGSYLYFLSMCACVGSRVRDVMEDSEEQLHQLFHRLMELFPNGKLPRDMVVGTGGPEELLDLLRHGPRPEVSPEELN